MHLQQSSSDTSNNMVIDLVLNSEICCVEKHRVRVRRERKRERERDCCVPQVVAMMTLEFQCMHMGHMGHVQYAYVKLIPDFSPFEFETVVGFFDLDFFPKKSPQIKFETDLINSGNSSSHVRIKLLGRT